MNRSALDDMPVIRTASMRALKGQLNELLEAARTNANDAASADGCLSAEVCTDPETEDGITVISRWQSRSALQQFLAWHETIAHASLADFSVEKPRARHCPVVFKGAR